MRTRVVLLIGLLLVGCAETRTVTFPGPLTVTPLPNDPPYTPIPQGPPCTPIPTGPRFTPIPRASATTTNAVPYPIYTGPMSNYGIEELPDFTRW
jgi:hypothetical protein